VKIGRGKTKRNTLKREEKEMKVNAGNSFCRGKLSTFDLLVLTSLDQLLFLLGILLIFFTKKDSLMRRSSVLSLPPHLVVPVKCERWT
jgi:hypothetical protein